MKQSEKFFKAIYSLEGGDLEKHLDVDLDAEDLLRIAQWAMTVADEWRTEIIVPIDLRIVKYFKNKNNA